MIRDGETVTAAAGHTEAQKGESELHYLSEDALHTGQREASVVGFYNPF